ncbi:BolA/IbaG family iron-sulfur metabolism protein [Gilvimarinus sp. SDUM040013]|uniref:BolA/IbaG family iron-sulfur metabolism protein n=1 Tax=Gilvimarinus gilvus TaxID=3058038 RepID=A0ABU4RS87_9GAMM|nr:BolA/IbaG family iron-sulfur metabolism protein [Gilvimarinus sp. SDUM040013]MDO3388197.1 BolA/IbaG family iron-sulfur metabolism protein [Gilvimarinus sp. SDUM040013]MDX6847747.1 BolA/IbaG family iron-sulfur metabolism protein [Gilvimarinus sp. SDUM040013]
MKPVQTSIEHELKQQFSPVLLTVENESHMHSVPPNSETHFKVTLVSDQFEGKRSVQRHQAVYAVLAEQMAGPVHALALHTYTPAEWRSAQVPESPNCLGGGGK